MHSISISSFSFLHLKDSRAGEEKGESLIGRNRNEGCGRETHTALGCASCCMSLSTTTRVPVSHVLNDTNAHYVFYCDFVGASELGPAALAVF